MQTVHHSRSQGFILLATLFVIALMTIGAAYFASRLEDLQSAAFRQQAFSEAEESAFSSRQVLMHAFATNPRDEKSVVVPGGALIADGRPYRLDEKTLLRVQDERGLISLNLVDERLLARFLAAAGVPVERQGRLIDTLADYIDVDDFRRLNGAEKSEYVSAGLPAPANDYLLMRDELWRIPGWTELFADLNANGAAGIVDRLMANFSATKYAGINVNTAPRAVLMSLPGVDPQKVGSLLDYRRNNTIRGLGDLSPYLNGPIDDEVVMMVSAGSWRLLHDRSDLPFLLECRLVSTPAAPDKPLQLHECRRRPRSEVHERDEPDEVGRALRRADKFDTGQAQPQDRAQSTSRNESIQRENNDPVPRLPWLSAPATAPRP